MAVALGILLNAIGFALIARAFSRNPVDHSLRPVLLIVGGVPLVGLGSALLGRGI